MKRSSRSRMQRSSHPAPGAALHTDPFPRITGAAEYGEVAHAPGREGSPAWDIIGYGAIAGLSDKQPFGTAVMNSGEGGYFAMHVPVVAPAESRLYEAVRRRADQAWLWRFYAPVGLQLLEEAAKLGPTVLSEAGREPFHETHFPGLPDPLARVNIQAPGERDRRAHAQRRCAEQGRVNSTLPIQQGRPLETPYNCQPNGRGISSTGGRCENDGHAPRGEDSQGKTPCR